MKWSFRFSSNRRTTRSTRSFSNEIRAKCLRKKQISMRRRNGGLNSNTRLNSVSMNDSNLSRRWSPARNRLRPVRASGPSNPITSLIHKMNLVRSSIQVNWKPTSFDMKKSLDGIRKNCERREGSASPRLRSSFLRSILSLSWRLALKSKNLPRSKLN